MPRHLGHLTSSGTIANQGTVSYDGDGNGSKMSGRQE